MLTGIVAGVISGVIVAVVSGALSRYSNSRFELRYACPGSVTLRHNRFWPVVIGGTWEFGYGPDLLLTPDARAATSGIIIGKFAEISLDNHYERPIGTLIALSYRGVPLRALLARNQRQNLYSWAQDPSQLLGDTKKPRRWKVQTVRIRHA